MFPAQEAYEAGLVRRVYKREELLAAARALAREMIENNAAVSVALIRQMMWKMLTADHPMEAHKIDSRSIIVRGASADARLQRRARAGDAKFTSVL